MHNSIRMRENSDNKDKVAELTKENEELSDIIRGLLEKSNESQKIYEDELVKLTS